MNGWNHVLWSDESKVNLFDCLMVSSMCSDSLVMSIKRIVFCLQSSVLVVSSWSGAAWVLLLVLGSCGSLRETWIPTCTVTYWSRPSMSPDLNPIEHMREVEKHRVSNIQQLRDHYVWKRTPVTTCAALVNSMPRRIKTVLHNNGAPTKYWHFGHVHLGCTHFCCQLFGQ